jgi:hypothetical protein
LLIHSKKVCFVGIEDSLTSELLNELAISLLKWGEAGYI